MTPIEYAFGAAAMFACAVGVWLWTRMRRAEARAEQAATEQRRTQEWGARWRKAAFDLSDAIDNRRAIASEQARRAALIGAAKRRAPILAKAAQMRGEGRA